MSDMKKGVFVTGATGWIGREVCRSLRAQGCFVVACDLKEQEGEWDRFISLDLCREPIVSLEEVDSTLPEAGEWSLVHCAGYAHRPIETPEEVERFYAINEQGSAKVVDFCKARRVDRIVYISSIAFYDWEANASRDALNEEASVSGATAYADSKLKGELCVRHSGLDYRVVRLATVFGDGDRANFSKLARALKAGKFIIPGTGEACKSVISVTRAAECIGQLALRTQVAYNIINLGFERAPSLEEICRSFSEVCGFTMARRAPLRLLNFAAFFGDLIARILPNFPLTTVNVRKLSQSSCVDCGRAAEIFPELSKVSFKDELTKAAKYYRDL